MKKFITSISVAAFMAVSVFAQEMPAELKAKLEAKSTELNADNKAKAKAWVKKQTEAWEIIQNMTFAADESDVKLIKKLADKKFPLDYSAQESFISEQASLASGLPDYKIQLGANAYNELKKKFEESGKTNLNSFIELLQTETAAKMQVDSLTTDKLRPKTFALIKKVAAEEFPGNYAEQLKTIKEILEGKRAQDSSGSQTAAIKEEVKRPATMSELEKIAKDLFSTQTYMTDGDKRGAVLLTEMQGKQVALIPFNCYFPGLTLSNARGEQLEYNESEVYISKTLPFVLVFPKELPQGMKNAVLISDKQYRDLVGSSQFVVGYLKQNIMSFPVKINSINDYALMLNNRLPVNFVEGTLMVNPATRETLSLIIPANPKIRKINWMQRSEVNRLMRDLESDAGRLEAVRIDNFGKWEKFSSDKFIEQKMQLERLKSVANDFIKLFTSSSLSDSENSPIIGQIVKKHIKEFKTRMGKSRFERAYKAYMLDMTNLIKSETRNLKNVEFYSGFTGELNKYVEVLDQVQKTFETASRSQAYLTLIQEDVKRHQGW